MLGAQLCLLYEWRWVVIWVFMMGGKLDGATSETVITPQLKYLYEANPNTISKAFRHFKFSYFSTLPSSLPSKSPSEGKGKKKFDDQKWRNFFPTNSLAALLCWLGDYQSSSFGRCRRGQRKNSEKRKIKSWEEWRENVNENGLEEKVHLAKFIFYFLLFY